MSKQGRRRAAKVENAEAAFAVDEDRYRAWIAHIFDRETIRDRWYFDIYPAPEFGAGPVETVLLIGLTMARSGIDLCDFHEKQVAHGLEYIFDQTASDTIYSFARAEVPVGLKVAAIDAMKHLFRDCLGVRCGPYLGHLSEGKGRPLNGFTYMLWDTTPLLWFDRNDCALFGAALRIMEFALSLSNDACIEGALHGLGHMRHRDEEQVEAIIDRFLATTVDAPDSTPASGQPPLRAIRPELRAYARSARRGMVL